MIDFYRQMNILEFEESVDEKDNGDTSDDGFDGREETKLNEIRRSIRVAAGSSRLAEEKSAQDQVQENLLGMMQ